MQLLRNADVYDPLPKGRRSILIGGERILWMGDELELPASLGVTVRDLGGRRVIPGLIDCHLHLTGGGGEAGMHTRGAPPQPSPATRRGGAPPNWPVGGRANGPAPGGAGGDGP